VSRKGLERSGLVLGGAVLVILFLVNGLEIGRATDSRFYVDLLLVERLYQRAFEMDPSLERDVGFLAQRFKSMTGRT